MEETLFKLGRQVETAVMEITEMITLSSEDPSSLSDSENLGVTSSLPILLLPSCSLQDLGQALVTRIELLKGCQKKKKLIRSTALVQ